jgi:hypothetical protein
MSKNYYSILSGIIVLFLLWGLTSCAHWGINLEQQSLVGSEPRLEEILNDLSKNDQSIRTLKGRGTFTLKTPQLERFLNSIRAKFLSITDYLYVVG